jgi:CBS domain-containing protein
MVDHGVHQVPIVRDGALVGMVTRADLMRYMQSPSGVAGHDTAAAEGIASKTQPAASRG